MSRAGSVLNGVLSLGFLCIRRERFSEAVGGNLSEGRTEGGSRRLSDDKRRWGDVQGVEMTFFAAGPRTEAIEAPATGEVAIFEIQQSSDYRLPVADVHTHGYSPPRNVKQLPSVQYLMHPHRCLRCCALGLDSTKPLWTRKPTRLPLSLFSS